MADSPIESLVARVDANTMAAFRRAQGRANLRRMDSLRRQRIKLSEPVETDTSSSEEDSEIVWRAPWLQQDSHALVASEYFRLFRYGYQGNTNTSGILQFNFLKTVFDRNVNFMGQVGIKKLLDQWSLYHTLFHSFEMRCPKLQILQEDKHTIVRAPAIMHLRISRTTIVCLYPHILQNERIVQKLIGQVLRVPVLIHFRYDENGIIDTFTTEADVTTGLVKLLGCADDVEFVSNGCHFRDDAELEILP